MKRISAFVTLLSLITSLFVGIPVGSATDAPAPTAALVNNHLFTDVTSKNIEGLYLANEKIVKGMPDHSLGLNRPLNRAEAMTIYTRLFGLEPKYNPNCTFPDVPADSWYSGFVSAMCEKKLVAGYPNGMFQASNQLNRAEALQILTRGLKELKQHDVAGYANKVATPSDVPSGVWFETAARYSIARNFAPLTSGKFDGGKAYTRNDLFVNLYRYLRTEEMTKDAYTVSLDPVVLNQDVLSKFTSDAEFDAYVKTLKEYVETAQAEGGLGGAEEGGFYEGALEEPTTGETAPTESAKDIESPPPPAPGESITNVQEAGVDEGGIVKAHGNYLVTLRRGKLFTVNLGDTLTKVDELNAYPEGLASDAWYDEMLISGDTVVVVGFSYAFSATELELFTIDGTGKLTRKETYFLDSNDYYSSRNYASRLVADELIFYMPAYLFDYGYGEVKLPALQKWENGTKGDRVEILKKTDVIKPVQAGDIWSPSTTLHTVVRCKVETGGTLSCGAKAVLGPYARTFYVSPNAVYLWVSEPLSFYEDVEQTRQSGLSDTAYVYRMELSEEARVSAMPVIGQPIDQFSFKEDSTDLNVLVRDGSWGDGMWNPEWSEGALYLLQVPLIDFALLQAAGITPAATPEFKKKVTSNYSKNLPQPSENSYNLQNRFVGEHLVYGGSPYWWGDTVTDQTLYVTAYKQDASTKTVPLTHSIDRIDLLGSDTAVVIGKDNEDLKFSSVKLTEATGPKVSDTYRIEKANQGEFRSHGFFFKPAADGSGVLGLPIRRQNDTYSSYLDESSEVLYLAVNTAKEFASLGSLKSSPSQPDDQCTVSCIDWYGNSRPIFYGGRVFALLGYELVEGKIANGVLQEVQRINFSL